MLADLEAAGEDLPQPLADRSFSGKLNLRLGSELHRRVALKAAEAGLSINSYLVSSAMEAKRGRQPAMLWASPGAGGRRPSPERVRVRVLVAFRVVRDE